MAPICITLLLLAYLTSCAAVWTLFDLVRNSSGHWVGEDSKGNTSYIKINSVSGNGPPLQPFGFFGCAIANIGDLDGDGIEDLAVGAKGEVSLANNTVQADGGAIYILFLTSIGDVREYVRISGEINGGPILFTNDQFGSSIALIGDLDNDGINDIAVGAPGNMYSAVYILYMQRNGTSRSTVMIRGQFEGLTNNTYIVNGPPIFYACKFGESVGTLNDLNQDGVPDLLVGQRDSKAGNNLVYVLFLASNGTVLSYTRIGSELGGGPNLLKPFNGFGSSFCLLPDLDGDGVQEVVIGVQYSSDIFSHNFNSGLLYVCLMNKTGNVKSFYLIDELATQNTISPVTHLPLIEGDECGASVITLGDINMDHMRQQKPDIRAIPARPSFSDIIVGCPQTAVDGYGGRTFMVFLDGSVNVLGYSESPNPKLDIQRGVIPFMQPYSQFGAAMAPYSDIDGNGVREFYIGAPGDSVTSEQQGAIYVLFHRRRRHHSPVFCFLCFVLSFSIPLGVCCLSCIGSTIYFFWRFRRRPDGIEKIVKESGVTITSRRTRSRKEAKVFVNEDSFA